MTTTDTDNLAARWARLGALFNVAPARGPAPDLERLLLDTARAAPGNPRLYILAVTWLAAYGLYVAAHRLKRLAVEELEPEHQATLGLILDTAVDHGAPKSLRHVVTESLQPAPQPGPLFEVDRGPLASSIEADATPVSKRWGQWVQPVEPKPDALRPPQWIVRHNPSFASRAAHKGDLRTSIIETFRRDLRGQPVSETELARRCAATLLAVRSALDDLQHELPQLRIDRRRGRNGSQILLHADRRKRPKHRRRGRSARMVGSGVSSRG